MRSPRRGPAPRELGKQTHRDLLTCVQRKDAHAHSVGSIIREKLDLSDATEGFEKIISVLMGPEV